MTASVGGETSIYSAEAKVNKQGKKTKLEGSPQIRGRSIEHIPLPTLPNNGTDKFENIIIGTQTNVNHERNKDIKLPDIYSSPSYEEFSLIDKSFNVNFS